MLPPTNVRSARNPPEPWVSLESCHNALRVLLTVLHVNALNTCKQDFAGARHQSRATYLLSIARCVTIVTHVEFDVLQTRSLRHLPMDTADIRFGVGEAQVYLEVLDVAEKVVLVHIPLEVSSSSCEQWESSYHCWLSAI